MLKTSIQAMGTIYRHPDDDPMDGFKKIHEAGFDGVDFGIEIFGDYDSCLATDGSCFFDRSMDELKAYFEPYKEAAAANSVEFSQGHSPFTRCPDGNEPGYEHFAEITRKNIELAAWLGIPNFVIHPFVFTDAAAKERERKLNFRYFGELMGTAKRMDVTICLENLFCMRHGHVREGVCANLSEALEYVDELNALAGEELFGFCFDMGHANLLATNVYEFVTGMGKRIKAVHLHDNNFVSDLHSIPYTFSQSWCGQPSADWEGLLAGLHDIGYNGVVNFETGPALYTAPEPLADATRKYIHEIGLYMADRIERG